MTILSKRSSTKAERIFSEILKKNHIPFKHRQVIHGHEIDFIVGIYAIEIDGHEQSASRNGWIIAKGFVPVHYNNKALLKNLKAVEQDIINKYGLSSERNSSASA
jgi:very-short-patch-repair endonuclease